MPGSWCIEPLTRNVTELYVNPAFCRMTGLPVEELLARIASRDIIMPARLSRLDHLCLFIDNLHAHIREDHLQYFRWKVALEGVIIIITYHYH